jgi:chromosome segregation ATPase
MPFDWKTLDAMLGVIALCVSLGTMAYTWLTSGARKNGEAIAALTSEADDLRGRVDRIEAKLDAMPDREDLHRLDKQIEGMSARFIAFESTLKAVQRATERVSDYLLNSGGKSS